jgi:hypothetical protein
MELALYPTTQRQGCSGVVAESKPVGDSTISTTAMTCLQQQNIVLDDGYGSSNSSPHSSGTVKLEIVYVKSIVFIFYSIN